MRNDFISIQESERKTLNKTLDKIGLKIQDDIIIINKAHRWEEVFMIERIRTQIPSTTNSLESSHGHLNEQIPLRNEFFYSIYRIAMMMIRKTNSYEFCVKGNFCSCNRTFKRRMKQINHNQMAAEINFYHSTNNKC